MNPGRHWQVNEPIVFVQSAFLPQEVGLSEKHSLISAKTSKRQVELYEYAGRVHSVFSGSRVNCTHGTLVVYCSYKTVHSHMENSSTHQYLQIHYQGRNEQISKAPTEHNIDSVVPRCRYTFAALQCHEPTKLVQKTDNWIPHI